MPKVRLKSQQAERRHRRTRLRLEYLLLAAFVAFCGWKFIQRIQEVRILRAQEAALLMQNQQTAQQNADLQRAIRYYRTPRYVEEEARAVLGFTTPGEVSIEIQPRQAQVVSVRPAPAVPASPPQPAWEQWWHTFFQ